jgi:hypothetical protein
VNCVFEWMKVVFDWWFVFVMKLVIVLVKEWSDLVEI